MIDMIESKRHIKNTLLNRKQTTSYEFFRSDYLDWDSFTGLLVRLSSVLNASSSRNKSGYKNFFKSPRVHAPNIEDLQSAMTRLECTFFIKIQR